jgi:hypothetical protein
VGILPFHFGDDAGELERLGGVELGGERVVAERGRRQCRQRNNGDYQRKSEAHTVLPVGLL